jgi:hypothetical protein
MKNKLKLIATTITALTITYATAQWEELYYNGYPKLGANAPINVVYAGASDIYAGGLFTFDGYKSVAYYHTPKWKLLVGTYNLQANDAINAIVEVDGFVYAGGQFTDSASGQHYVGRHYGSGGWSAAGGATFNGTISTLTKDKFGNVYAAGGFTNGFGENYVAKFDGSVWTEVSNGTNRLGANNGILSVATDTFGNIYAAGYFTNGSGQRYVAKWNGLQWTELTGMNCNGYIYRLATDAAGNVYAAGSFTNANGNKYVAKWNGSTWSEMGGDNSLQAASEIFSLAVDNNGSVYAAGEFKNANNNYYVAICQGTGWSELGIDSGALNANAPIQSISCGADGKIYCAGNFTNTDGNPYVAVYTPIATGINETTSPQTIAVYPNPFNNSFTVGGTADVIAIMNAEGRIMHKQTNVGTQTTIQTDNWPAGIYYLTAVSNSQTVTTRIIKTQ